MKQYLTEALKTINEDPSLVSKYKDDFLFKVICAHAFLPNFKFILPEGEPPFKPADQPMGMTDTNLNVECKKFHSLFCNANLKALKREQLFIGLLEAIHPEEAKVLIAVKDQKLTKLYPKITWKLVSDVGIIPAPPAKEKKQKAVDTQ
jgi:hypothetical protein